jgi:hypothetical protein
MKANRKSRAKAAQTRTVTRSGTPIHSTGRFATMKRIAGVAGDKKDVRIGGRISAKLVRLARKRTGIRSDTALIEAGLLTLATEDEFGRWLISQAGRLDRDLDVGL